MKSDKKFHQSRQRVRLAALVHFAILLLVAVSFMPAPASAGFNKWTSIGPEGGEIVALTLDPGTPTTLYGLSNTDLYKSTDAGINWVRLNTTGLHISGGGYVGLDLIIDPVTTTTMYMAGVGGGVSKSTDSGLTWTGINSGLTGSVSSVLIDPSNPSILYAGTRSGVFKTINGGANWGQISTGLPIFGPTDHPSLWIDPLTPSTIYLSIRTGGLYKSTNGGASWVALNNGLPPTSSFTDLAIDPLTPSTLYIISQNSVYKSTNSGTSWVAINNGLPNTGIIHTIAIRPDLPSTLYIETQPNGSGTTQQIFSSLDGGALWLPINSHPGVITNLIIDPVNTTTIYATQKFANLSKSTDGGITWTDSISGINARGVGSLAVDPATSSTLYADGFRSINSGGSWSALPFTATVFAFDPITPAIQYAAHGGGVSRSTDGGVIWSAVMNAGLPANTTITSLAIDPLTPAALYAGVSINRLGGGIFKSTDSGANWTAINTGLPTFFNSDSLVIDPSSHTTLYAGGRDEATWTGAVFKSVDGGVNWTAASTGLPGNIVEDLAIDPLTPTTLYAATWGGGSLFKSTDGGANWVAMNTGLGFAVLNGLAIDPLIPTTLYASAGARGIFKSVDGGANWSSMTNGLDGVSVNTLAIDPVTPSTVYAGTYGRGVMHFSSIAPPSSISLSLNRSAFDSTVNKDMVLTATTVAGTPPIVADIYIALRLPNGSLLFMQPNGSLAPVAAARFSGISVPDFTGPIFSYAMNGSVPIGSYTWLAALMQPGTMNMIGNLAEVPFTFAP